MFALSKCLEKCVSAISQVLSLLPSSTSSNALLLEIVPFSIICVSLDSSTCKLSSSTCSSLKAGAIRHRLGFAFGFCEIAEYIFFATFG